MKPETEKGAAGEGRARWVAAGFLGAFAASILTVIWTGLMVEGRPEEFDAGFRSVTMAAGEARAIELIFDVPAIISILSSGMTLLPGDIIATGTPAGRRSTR